MTIQKLNDCGLLTEIWLYLSFRDIYRLIAASKYFRDISIRINEVVSREIYLDLSDLNNRSKGMIVKVLRNIIFYFSNVSKLFLKCYSFTEEVTQYTRINKSLKIIFDCESICRSLQHLNVCIESDEGVKGISCLRNIQKLNISNSLITEDAMSEIGSMVSITSLDISYCEKIGDNGLFHISKLSKLKSLDIGGVLSITDSGLSHLSCLNNMTSLDISDCNRITTLSFISSLTNITSLNLSLCYNLTNEGLLFISSITNLTSLDFYHCESLTDEGLAFISGLISMTYLNLSYCYLITTLSPISSLTSITSLNISDCNIETLSPIISMSKIVELNIEDYSCDISDNGLYYISHLININSLTMSLASFTSEGFDFLCSLKNLKKIKIGSDIDSFHDINLSSLVIDMFVNITEFSCLYYRISPVEGVTGFFYVQELRRQKYGEEDDHDEK